MNCMKCGKKTKDDHVFCDECLADMTAHPVKSGTVIQIPNRPSAAAIRRAAAQKRGVPLEEQLEQMRKTVRYLLLTILALALALCLSIILLLSKPKDTALPAAEDLGRNYSTYTPEAGT